MNKNGITAYIYDRIKYRDFLDYFKYSRINPEDTSLLITLLKENNDKLNTISEKFIKALQHEVKVKLLGHLNEAIYSFGLLFNNKRFPFDASYINYFVTLAKACVHCNSTIGFTVKQYYYEMNTSMEKWQKYIFDNQINKVHINARYNNNCLHLFLVAYCYYNDLDYKLISVMANFFMGNYEQIMGILETNNYTMGHTINDHDVITFNALEHYIDFYNNNHAKVHLKEIK